LIRSFKLYANNMQVGNVVFKKTGEPALVEAVDSKGIQLNESTEAIQKAHPFGIRNGLTPQERTEFSKTLSSIQDQDKKKEVNALYAQMKSYESKKVSPQFMDYLKGELLFRMNTYGVKPDHLNLPLETIEDAIR